MGAQEALGEEVEPGTLLPSSQEWGAWGCGSPGCHDITERGATPETLKTWLVRRGRRVYIFAWKCARHRHPQDAVGATMALLPLCSPAPIRASVFEIPRPPLVPPPPLAKAWSNSALKLQNDLISMPISVVLEKWTGSKG